MRIKDIERSGTSELGAPIVVRHVRDRAVADSYLVTILKCVLIDLATTDKCAVFAAEINKADAD